MQQNQKSKVYQLVTLGKTEIQDKQSEPDEDDNPSEVWQLSLRCHASGGRLV